ncbi:TrmB family transcriptional regulator [Natrinema salifodinae]|uniref:Sugar-specific transcriptional regulator TrmB n=1 Tax=Natrinema salifodinae TaxID=1202768 RepID=A0A1I0NB61_9EURY|nr:helix-turn-helix domain-containing protein [Natrinema salifodinae]SEV98417.1 Sugar-specific transcriptional regulator TrmB [Natrinema salifodinae]
MSRPEKTLEKADKPLQDIMGWGKYQAAAYRCLVAEGPLEAREIVVRTDIHQGRIYDVLDDLKNEGVVTEQDANPTIYDVQNPEKLIGERKEEFNNKATELIETLGTAYELNPRSRDQSTSSSWVLGGQSGTIRKLREMLEQAEESVYALEPDPRWYETSDLRILERLADSEVDVKPVIWNARQQEIKEFTSFNIPVWTHQDVDQTFYVIDQEHVVMEIDRGNTGIIFSDETMASVFTREFEEIFNDAEEFDAHA